jgi:beta-galactosidase GanA
MRAEKPGVPYWLLDAPVEGGGRGGAEALAWLSILMGGELCLFDTWRAAWAGHAMSRAALVAPTGRWTGHKEALASLAARIKEHAAFLDGHPPVEARLGVIMSNESAWAFSIDPPEPGFEYESAWRDEFYLPVAQSHYWRDVIDQTADFCPYHVLILPLVPIVYRPTKDRLKEWVRGGGCLLVGPLSGYRTEEFTAWTDHEFGGLEELMGATCSGSFSTSEDEKVRIVWGTDAVPGNQELAAEAASPQGAELPASTPRGGCHSFSATTAHVLARYENGPTAGQAAILMNKVGQGTVITLGARVDRETYLDLVHTLCELAKIQPLASGSPHVAVIPRMNPDTSIAGYGVVNLTEEQQSVTIPKGGRDRLSGRAIATEVALAPFEVVLVEVQPAEAPTLTAEPANQGGVEQAV